MKLFKCKGITSSGKAVVGWPIKYLNTYCDEVTAIFDPYTTEFYQVDPVTLSRVHPDCPLDYLDAAVELLKEYSKIPKEERTEK